MLDLNIKCGNSLITDEFNWEEEFPEVFLDNGFDVVFSNPPYVRQELIKEIKPELKEEYEVYHGRGDLYIYFFEKAIKLLKPNGIMSFICSNTYTNAGFAKQLREFILKNTILKYTDHTGEKLFNATVDTSSIFIQKTKPSKNHKIIINNKFRIHQSNVTKDGFYFDEKSIKLRQIPIRCNTNKIEEICYINQGMKLNSKKQGEFVKNDLISETQNDNHTHEYIEGKNIKPYEIKEIKYLEYNSERVPNKVSGPRFRELFTVPEKIIIKRIGKNAEAIIDTNQLLTNDSLLNCVFWEDLEGIENRSIGNIENRKELEKNSNNFNSKFLVAILNSPVGTFLLNKVRGNNTNNVAIEAVKQIPIAKTDTTTQNKIAEQVDIMMDKNASNNAKANAEAIINKTIYEIYQLTEEEIAIVEGNLK